MRAGVTLLELVLVLMVAGIMTGIAAPRVKHLLDSTRVEQAAQQIVSAHRRARITAILRSRVVALTVRPDSLSLRAPGDTAALWSGAGPAWLGATLEGPARSIVFSPVGVTLGLSNASFRLTRGQAERTVVVSRLGRVRVER